MRIALIDDADVLTVLGNADPTDYIASKLRTAYPSIDTPSTLRKLKDMERRGMVKRVKTHYFLNNIKWSKNDEM